MRSAQRTFWLALAAFMAYCSLLVLIVGTIFGAILFPTFPLNRLGLLASSLVLVGAATSLKLAFHKNLSHHQVLTRELPLCCYLASLLTYTLLPDHQWWILAAGFALLPLLVPLWARKG